MGDVATSILSAASGARARMTGKASAQLAQNAAGLILMAERSPSPLGGLAAWRSAVRSGLDGLRQAARAAELEGRSKSHHHAPGRTPRIMRVAPP